METTRVRNLQAIPERQWAPGHFSAAMVEREDYSVELKRIPPGGGSELHSHRLSRQFFFVLEGAARIHVAGKVYTLSPREGMDVDPGVSHCIKHVAGEVLVLLLVSVPRLSPDDVKPG